MADLDWPHMFIEAKLDWLKAAIENFIKVENGNIDTRRGQMSGIMSRLAALEEAVNAAPPRANPAGERSAR